MDAWKYTVTNPDLVIIVVDDPLCSFVIYSIRIPLNDQIVVRVNMIAQNTVPVVIDIRVSLKTKLLIKSLYLSVYQINT